MSAWRRSISSTKTTSETPSRAYNSPLSMEAEAVAATEAAAFEAAGAAFEAVAVEAAGPAFAAAEAAVLAFEAAALAGAGAAAVAAGALAGAAAAACHGEVAASARRKRLAITLTEATVRPGFDQVRPGQRCYL